MNAAADSLMSIFGMTPVRCCYCIQSIATDKNDLYCTAKAQIVQRRDQCENFERATGSDDE